MVHRSVKKALFTLLAVVMLISGIRAETTYAILYTGGRGSPLRAPNVRRSIVWQQQDLFTGESIGNRQSRSLPEYVSRGRKRSTLYRQADSPYLPAEAIPFAYSLSSSAGIRRRKQEPYVRSWIIRYIHDQDGEKDGAHPL